MRLSPSKYNLPTAAEIVPHPAELDDAAAAYAGASRSENTKRASTTDFVAFSRWC